VLPLKTAHSSLVDLKISTLM